MQFQQGATIIGNRRYVTADGIIAMIPKCVVCMMDAKTGLCVKDIQHVSWYVVMSFGVDLIGAPQPDWWTVQFDVPMWVWWIRSASVLSVSWVLFAIFAEPILSILHCTSQLRVHKPYSTRYLCSASTRRIPRRQLSNDMPMNGWILKFLITNGECLEKWLRFANHAAPTSLMVALSVLVVV